MSFEIKAPLIIVFTIEGEIARMIAKYRPIANIIAIRFRINKYLKLNKNDNSIH
jgi:pyruvate kinase